MAHNRIIFFVSGVLLCILAIAMLVPAVIDLWAGDNNWRAFAFSAATTGFFGVLLSLAFHSKTPPKLPIKQAFLLTFTSWLSVSLFASLPLYLSGDLPSFTDSFFESVSAITTTGATVFSDLDKEPAGILLWRALLQWLGGIGIVVMALSVMPALRIGGMQLFQSEFSDRTEKILPRVSQISSSIVGTYLILSVSCGVLLWMAGMKPFDALCHAMTTVSTAGFSTHDNSIAVFNNVAVECVMMVFMFIGGCTLILCTRVFHGHIKDFFHDSQIQTFFKILVCTILMMSLWLWLGTGVDFADSLRYAAFNVTSILTTSGFSSADYSVWGTFPVLFFFFMMFFGGCTGSTSGGIKVFRFQILLRAAKQQLEQLTSPHGVFVPSYNGNPVTEKAFVSVLGFIALYFICYGILAIALTLSGMDTISSLSGSVAMISNIGPALGAAIGPSGNYSEVPMAAKWLMSFGMIAGRLELLTVILLLTPSFWKN